MALIRTNSKIGNSTSLITEVNTEAVTRYEQRDVDGCAWALYAILADTHEVLLAGFGSRNKLESALELIEKEHGKGAQGRINWVYKEEDNI